MSRPHLIFDARAPGIGILAMGAGGAVPVALGASAAASVWTALLCGAVAATLAPMGLPPWQDSRRSPRSAGFVLAITGLVVLVLSCVYRAAAAS